LGVLVVLLVVVYFVATSSAFFKGVILPRASAALNAKITVSDASISPFKQVVLRDLKVQTTGADPLISASEVRLRYSLMDIMRGNINVDEVTLDSPGIALVENSDGSSNLEPILKKLKESPSKPQEPSKPSKPPQIDVKKVVLSNGTIRHVKLYAGGKRDQAELSNVNVSLSNLKNNQAGKLTLGADIRIDRNPPAPDTNGVLQAKLTGNFDFALTADLKPGSVQGTTRFEVTRAEGGLAQVAAFAANLDCAITPTEIKQVALRFQRGDTRLGELRVSGPFNMEKNEGRLAVELQGIDKKLLNLAGASSGLDFGPTTISSTNQIELTKAGTTIGLVGQFNLNQLQVTRTNQTTPALDLRANYDLSVDPSNVLVRAFTLTGTQKGNQFLRGELTSPMAIALGNAGTAVGDSALNLTVTHLDLANWNAFAGGSAPTGDVNLKVQLLSKQAGKNLAFDVNSEIANLTVMAGTNQYAGVGITMQLSGEASEMKQFKVPQYKLQLTKQNQPLVVVSGSAAYDKSVETADAELDTRLMLAALLQAFPQPGMNVSSGTAELKTHVAQKQQNQTVTGSFTLADFTGKVGSNSFRSFGTTADVDIGLTPQEVQIRKISGKITEGQTVGGTFDLNGRYGLTNQSAQLSARLANFNQTGLRTFLEPMLAEKKLVSVALNANASVQYDPQAASTVKAGLQVTNLVVNDLSGQIPAQPLAASMQVDLSLNKMVAELRQVSLGLTPTALGTNQVQLTGKVDMSQTTNIQGNLKLAADSLDLTTYYDLFAAKKAAPERPTSPGTSQTGPSATPAGPEKEPEPTRLPLSNFTAEAAIGAIYLHEVQITNVQVLTKIDGGHVVLNPCKLVLNGAPVNTTVDLDLGVPGYKYDLGFNAQAIPLAPLVNSFKPEYKGIVSGTMTAQTKIDGSGTTGPSLQKSLTGHFDVVSTNLNLSVDNLPNKSVSARLLKTVVNAITVIPDLVKNPSGAGASLLQGLVSPTSGGSTRTGQTTDLKKSPINSIVMHGTMGSGQILLQQTMIQSPAFRADATGTVTLAPVLTNSTIQIPVAVSLERGVAQSIHLLSPDTPTNAAYARLPDFLTEKGTLGDPKADVNRTVLIGAVLKGASGLAGKNSGLLQGLGGALTGSGSSGTNTTGTNQSKLGGLLEGLGGFGTKAATNVPATNQSPVGNLIDGLFGPKKK